MYLQTEAGLLNPSAIVLIEDHPPNDGDWPIHYAYGSKVRTTTADPALIREYLNQHRKFLK